MKDEVNNTRKGIPKGTGGRWNKPHPRYTTAEQSANDKVLREQPGWRNGARVYKV